MSDSLAVDIVILPPDEVMDRAIALNKEYESRFTLNKKDHLPHITLSQAIIKKSDLKKIEVKLETIASTFKPLKLSASLANSSGFTLEVHKSPRLKNLHVTVMDKLKDLVSYDAKAEHFYDDPVSDKTVAWVCNFLTNSAYDKYYPHITLSISGPVDLKETMDFTATRLVLCHLGDYNTCRKILFETNLG